jgi:hypothetical protein
MIDGQAYSIIAQRPTWAGLHALRESRLDLQGTKAPHATWDKARTARDTKTEYFMAR